MSRRLVHLAKTDSALGIAVISATLRDHAERRLLRRSNAQVVAQGVGGVWHPS